MKIGGDVYHAIAMSQALLRSDLTMTGGFRGRGSPLGWHHLVAGPYWEAIREIAP